MVWFLLAFKSSSLKQATTELDELKEVVRDFSEQLDPFLVRIAQVFIYLFFIFLMAFLVFFYIRYEVPLHLHLCWQIVQKKQYKTWNGTEIRF